jgi:cytochrome c biogenesis protein CcmG, thiol:disulfide interchange protein DsbE
LSVIFATNTKADGHIAAREIPSTIISEATSPMQMIRVAFIVMGITAFGTAWPANLDLAEYRGKVVYLDFWASWCGPCRQSFPWLSDMQSRNASDSFVVVAVNLDQDREHAQRFLNDFPVNFPVIYDPKGEIASSFKIKGMPSAVLIDRAGHVRFHHDGFSVKKEEEYEAHLQTLLAEKAP